MDQPTFLERIVSSRRAWDSAIALIPLSHMQLAANSAGWTVKDIIAHVAWSENEMLLLFRDHVLAGSPLWELPLDERNQVVYLENRDRSVGDVLGAESRLWEELWPVIQALTDQDLNDPTQYQSMPLDWQPWEILAGSTYKHWDDHVKLLPKSISRK